MTAPNTYQDLTEWLTHQGYSAEEVTKIRSMIREFDHEMYSDSIMDSVAGGTFNLSNIIHDAIETNDGMLSQ